VSYYSLPAAARGSGLRACLRCRPDELELRAPQAGLVQGICRLLDEHLTENPNLDFLSRQLKVSPSHLQRIFKQLMGISPRQYLEARRADRFKEGINTGRSVTEAIYDAGYGSSSRLYEKAAEQIGMTPATYRKGGQGMTIGYTIVESPLGWLLVGATGRGICSVKLGDDGEQLRNELQLEFPRAEIGRDDKQLQSQVKTLLECLAGQAPHAELPLDLQGTAFQMRVWKELRRIPRGQTVSYKELAARIGQPTAARAVARACATNPVAIITPCHRVVRENGALGGYRWGIERKRALLENEEEGT
jgi:AraC family transcriptional regulator of adaptative response/methylated-DNA-[protein]-cysteine methyltransferase